MRLVSTMHGAPWHKLSCVVVLLLGLTVSACGIDLSAPSPTATPANTALTTPSSSPQTQTPTSTAMDPAGTDLDELRARPVGIDIDPDATPVEVAVLPTAPSSALFANPDQPAYDARQGLAPDVQRMLDLLGLQFSLEQYRYAHGQYPATLDGLFPDFPPLDEFDQPRAELPVDPVSQESYRYEPVPDGHSYLLSATLESGVVYTVNEP